MRKLLMSMIALITLSACVESVSYEGEYIMRLQRTFEPERMEIVEGMELQLIDTMKYEYSWEDYAKDDYIYKSVNVYTYYLNDETKTYLKTEGNDEKLAQEIIRHHVFSLEELEKNSEITKTWDDDMIQVTLIEKSPERKTGFFGRVVPEKYSLTLRVKDYEHKLKEYGYTYTLEQIK